MNRTLIAVLVFDIVMAMLFVAFAAKDAAGEFSWWSTASIIVLGIAIVAGVFVIAYTESKRPDGYACWNRNRLMRSYERNLGYSRAC